MRPKRQLPPVRGRQPPAPLAQHQARIDTIFAASSVEAVLERLDRDGSAFAADTARLMRSRSPTSLKLAFRLCCAGGKALSRDECLKMEYRVGLAHGDGHMTFAKACARNCWKRTARRAGFPIRSRRQRS